MKQNNDPIHFQIGSISSHLCRVKVLSWMNYRPHAKYVMYLLPLPAPLSKLIKAKELLHDAKEALGARSDL